MRGFYENLFVDKVVFDHNKLLAPLPPHLSQEVVMSTRRGRDHEQSDSLLLYELYHTNGSVS